MSGNWIKLYRKIEESSFYHDSRIVHLWVHILIKAYAFEGKTFFGGEEIIINPGQFVTGRKKLSSETGIEESKIQRSLKVFEKCLMIEQQTNSQSRLITVLNWDMYQESEQQMNNKRTASEQRVNTKRESKKEESKNKTYSEDSKEFRLSLFLLNNIRKRKPDYKIPDLQKWSIQSDYILRIDKRDLEEVKKIIIWCQTDEFWQDNILSTAKLRKQYDQLVLKMNKNINIPKTETVSHPSHNEL